MLRPMGDISGLLAPSAARRQICASWEPATPETHDYELAFSTTRRVIAAALNFARGFPLPVIRPGH